MAMNDDEIDAALATLTDESPSPALRANVMRRVQTEAAAGLRSRRPAAGFGWRAAVAAATVLVVAASLWLVVRPAPERQVATTRREPVGRATPRGESAGQPGVRPRVDELRAGGVGTEAGRP